MGKRPKTFREIAEMHYAPKPSNEFDKQYRENRINALEKLLTEQLHIHDVVGRSEQLEPYEPNYFPKCMFCKSIHDPEICCQD